MSYLLSLAYYPYLKQCGLHEHHSLPIDNYEKLMEPLGISRPESFVIMPIGMSTNHHSGDSFIEYSSLIDHK